ncbi:glycosyltransferase [Sinomonas sp. R1AF57]|uniref:glycosyltransferase n=1 Tax=Sinomonas sp. R1AF57 TaxID=2020377 RepID=UPI000B60CEEB|nr:glycosyltransferase [Sinomonas sp. R1AF57]ASN51487.1 hypothetical protein CGQ25_04865 [Sinomonas sp. R1AF57]
MITSEPAGSNAGATFEHFVLTRFNVRNRYYAGNPGDIWLRSRLALFEKYTAASFGAQTVKDFRWLVLVDSESPQWFRAELGVLGRELFEIVDIKGAFNAQAAAGVVASRLRTPFILTTRVDNDDAVARDFIESIQRAWRPVHQPYFINLVKGAQLADGRVYRRPYTQNPFVTLSEPRSADGLATVFVRRHYEVQAYAPVTNVGSDHPLWLQVIHGGNVLTELVGMRTRARAVEPWFACDLGARDRPLEFAREVMSGTARIALRLALKPRRVVNLGRALVARPIREP